MGVNGFFTHTGRKKNRYGEIGRGQAHDKKHDYSYAAGKSQHGLHIYRVQPTRRGYCILVPGNLIFCPDPDDRRQNRKNEVSPWKVDA